MVLTSKVATDTPGRQTKGDKDRRVQFKLVRLKNNELEFTGVWSFRGKLGYWKFNLIPEQ